MTAIAVMQDTTTPVVCICLHIRVWVSNIVTSTGPSSLARPVARRASASRRTYLSRAGPAVGLIVLARFRTCEAQRRCATRLRTRGCLQPTVSTEAG